jgi:excisionase family DNA binding protein
MVEETPFVTVQQAADVLRVPRRRIWQLIKQGRLHTEPNPLDRRSKLIPRSEIEVLLHLPRAPKRRRTGKFGQVSTGSTPIHGDREDGTDTVLWPRTVGMVSDGAIQSEDLDDYLREHWRPE